MSRSWMIAALTCGLSLCGGCRTAGTTLTMPQSRHSHETAINEIPTAPISGSVTEPRSRLTPVAYEESAASTDASQADDPLAGYSELSMTALVEAVKSRNPTLQAAYAAWSAASQKYPQAIALDDPMFQSMYAPRSWSGASDVPASYYFGIAQNLPWPGKRELRGQQAVWENLASMYDYQESQLRLSEAARLAFFDYYLNARQRELNAANREATRGFREIARAKYESNLATYSDVLQADVELAKLEEREIELDQDRAVVIARINTLLHRRPDHPLPVPPDSLPADTDLPQLDVLRQTAEHSRPELQAMLARVESERYAVELACKEYFPDFEVMARYDKFWFDKEQQPQLGLNMNVPLNKSKRAAAVREAQARVCKMHAEYEQARDSIWHDVAAAYARTNGSQKMSQLYASKLLPAAEENLATTKSGYSSGTLDFLRLVEAQRQIIELREQQQAAIVELHRRRTELERAVGASISLPE